MIIIIGSGNANISMKHIRKLAEVRGIKLIEGEEIKIVEDLEDAMERYMLKDCFPSEAKLMSKDYGKTKVPNHRKRNKGRMYWE